MRDAAHGRRRAQRGDAGQIISAYGIDLSPLRIRLEQLKAAAEAHSAFSRLDKRGSQEIARARRIGPRVLSMKPMPQLRHPKAFSRLRPGSLSRSSRRRRCTSNGISPVGLISTGPPPVLDTISAFAPRPGGRARSARRRWRIDRGHDHCRTESKRNSADPRSIFRRNGDAPLDGRCTYNVALAKLPAQWWSFTLYDRDGCLVGPGPYPVESAALERGPAVGSEGPKASARAALPQPMPTEWSILVGPRGQGDLPTAGLDQFELTLRLYLPDGTGKVDPPRGVLPRLTEEHC